MKLSEALESLLKALKDTDLYQDPEIPMDQWFLLSTWCKLDSKKDSNGEIVVCLNNPAITKPKT